MTDRVEETHFASDGHALVSGMIGMALHMAQRPGDFVVDFDVDERGNFLPSWTVAAPALAPNTAWRVSVEPIDHADELVRALENLERPRPKDQPPA